MLANEDVLVQQSSKALEMWQVTNPLPLRLQLAPKERKGILTWSSKILPKTKDHIYIIYTLTRLLQTFALMDVRQTWKTRELWTALHPDCWKRIPRSFHMWKGGLMSCLSTKICYPSLLNQQRVEPTEINKSHQLIASCFFVCGIYDVFTLLCFKRWIFPKEPQR